MVTLHLFIWISILLNINFCFCVTFPINSVATKSASNISEEYQLIFAHVIYRHGDRNIIETYPNNQYTDIKYWPEGGYGELTNEGRRQHYELGKYIRRRYNNLISKYYLSNEVYIRSTDVDRTLMSAQANLAGLYPPTGRQIWLYNFYWQPIPVHTIPLKEDNLLYPITPCPRFSQLFDQHLKSIEIKSIMEKYRNFIDFLQTNSGIQNITLKKITVLYDTLFVQNLKGFVLQDWEKEALNSNRTLEYLAAVYYRAFSYTTEMKKLEAGFLLKEIFDRFKNKSLSLLQPDRKLWIYSAHDLTIANFLNALNLFEDMHIPPYDSSVYFDLYKRGSQYYVQLFYRRMPTEKVPPLEIPNCGQMCPLNRLYEIYKDILPTESEDYATLCQLKTPKQ